MTISSQRFRFLDQETNIGTVDFSSLTDNSIYTAAVDVVDSGIAAVKETERFLTDMEEEVSSLIDMGLKMGDDVLNKISDAIGGVIDKVLAMELPDFAKDILDKVKELDLGGVKDFFIDMLKVGGMFLCNNLDFLKSFMLGYALSGNILSGLLIGLLLGWLDRICKGFTEEEVLGASNKGKLDMVFNNGGINITPETVLGKYSNLYSSFVDASAPYAPTGAYTKDDFLDRIKGNSILPTIQNLRSSEISSVDKRMYLSSIDQDLPNYEPSSMEYSNLLEARGELINLPLISRERMEKANSYSNLNDSIGSMSLNLQNVDLTKINTHSLSVPEISLLDKLTLFKENTANNQDINTRNHSSGSFSNFDFSTLMPAPTGAELAYLEKLPGLPENHRYNGLHPTSEIFTEQTMPGSTRLSSAKKPTSLAAQNRVDTDRTLLSPRTNTPPNNPSTGKIYTPMEGIVTEGTFRA